MTVESSRTSSALRSLLALAALLAWGSGSSCAPPRDLPPENAGAPPVASASPEPAARGAHVSAPGRATSSLRTRPPLEAVFSGDTLTGARDVRACLPRADGSVLAATGGGLVLLHRDGRVSVWTARDGLPETRVHALLDEGERVWVGTESGAAEVDFPGGALRVLRAVPTRSVRAFARHEGALHAATWGAGLQRLDDRREAFVGIGPAPTRLESSRLSSLAVFEGALHAGGADGLVRFREGKPVRVAGAPRSIWALASGADRLWIGSLTGIDSLASGALRREGAADARSLAVRGETVFVGTFGEGALERAGQRWASATGLEGRGFFQAVGAEGTLRCAGTRDGLFVQRGGGAGWEEIAIPALPSSDLSALALDGDKLWLGTFDRGLAVLENGRAREVGGGRLDPKVNALAVDRAGAQPLVWAGTARGLLALDPASGEPMAQLGAAEGLPSSDVHALAALPSGGVLVGTARGAAVVREGVVTALSDKRGIAAVAVWAVAATRDGTLYLGTSRGLLVGTESSAGVVERGSPQASAASAASSWVRLSMSTGDLADDWVTAIAVRGPVVYAGTYNAGVTLLRREQGALRAAAQLGGGYVNLGGVLVHGETLFAATMSGLLRRPADGRGGWETVAGAAPGKDVTAVVPAGDALWVASRRGASRLGPAAP